MNIFRLEATVQHDGSLTLQNIPLQTGETVEVLILVREPARPLASNPYPLHGLPLSYQEPFEPVTTDDWSALS